MANWLTVKQLASYLQLSPAKVYELAKREEIPSVRIGNQWRFDRDAVDRSLSDKGGSRR
jgi:excisionase family DNA binding protein